MKEFKSLTDSIELNNGVLIPVLGFGTWQSPDGDIAYKAVTNALDSGYRHVDTAAAYGNEESVGRAVNDWLKKRREKRESLFITTKLQNPDHGYKSTKKAIDRSLSLLGLDYIDLYLIHWPNPIAFRDNWAESDRESWRAMEEAYREGKIRALGLSNFHPHHIDVILSSATIAPAVNQIKFCPGINQKEVASYSREKNMVLEAYSPLGTGGVLSDPVIKEIAEKYGKTPAQIAIRYALESGYIPLPKSVTEERIRENSNVFDFSLTPLDMKMIEKVRAEGVKEARNPDEIPF